MKHEENRMPDPAVVLFGAREAIIACIGIVAALLGYNAKNVVNRLNGHDNKLDKKVDKNEYNNTIKSIRDEIQKGVAATKQAHDQQSKEMREFHSGMTNRIDKLVDKI